MFIPSLNKKDNRHIVCYLEAFENISAFFAGIKTDPKKNVCIVEREMSFEYKLYTEHFPKTNIFPKMISCVVNEERKTVYYIFERMIDLLGGGSMGLFFEGMRFYGPKIRDDHPCYLVLDVITIALHVLYELNYLHEELGVVHGDISPGNIMFSEADDMWKLNDFQTALKCEDSLKTERIGISTREFTCPVAEETGIYDKASDIYSVGDILFSLFLTKLERQAQEYADQLPEGTIRTVKELMSIARDMTKPVPKDRPNIKQLITHIYFLMQYNLLEGFPVYGSKTMMPRIENFIFGNYTKNR